MSMLKKYFLKPKSNLFFAFVIVFFMIWKFFLVSILWNDRSIPPEPDDSYIYITHIGSVIDCPSLLFCGNSLNSFDNYSSVDHLTYRLVLGILGKFLGTDAISTYKISFYFGIILLIPVLVYLLKMLFAGEKNKETTLILSLLFLALYNGSGSYHGFFWVVPSFFCVLIFFIILAFLMNEKSELRFYSLSFFLVLANSFTHSLSAYFNIIIVAFCFLLSLFNRRFEIKIIKRSLYVFVLGFVISFFASKIFVFFSKNGNPYGVGQLLTNKVELFTDISKFNAGNSGYILSFIYSNVPDFVKLSVYEIQTDYINWIWPNIFAFILFDIILFFTYKGGHYKVLSLFFACLLFTIASSINPYGYRSLIILWPVTYILYSVGVYEIYLHIFKKNTFVSKLFVYVFIFLFCLLNLFFSIFFNSMVNNKQKVKIDLESVSYLNKEIQLTKKVYIPEGWEYINQMELFYNQRLFLITDLISDADYIIYPNQLLSNTKSVSSIEKIKNLLLNYFGGKKVNVQEAQNQVEKFSDFILLYSGSEWRLYKRTRNCF